MYLYYGGYWFDKNEATVTISKRPVFDQRGYRQFTRETWTVDGVRIALGGQVALTASLALLQTALSANGGDIGLYLDDQATLTTHYMVSSRTVGGTRITAYDFPRGNMEEYVVSRTFNFTIEADFYDFINPLIAFNESVTFEGNGGPRRIFLECAEGPPQEQIVSQQTSYRAIQQGTAQSIGLYPSAPPPIWPQAIHGPEARISRIGPTILAGRPYAFGVQWSYAFESSFALSGNPTIS